MVDNDFVGPLRPAELRPDFVGPIQPAEERDDFVGPRRPTTTKKKSSKPSPVVIQPAEERDDFVGPIQPAEERDDFVGPRRPKQEETKSRINTGFVSRIEPPSTITEKIFDFRETLIRESQEAPSQLKRTTSGLALGVVTPAATLTSAGSFIIKSGSVSPVALSPERVQQNILIGKSITGFFKSPVKTSEKVLIGELKEFERDPSGALALLGLGKLLGTGITKKKIKGSGKVSISGVSQQTGKAFVAGEGEVIVESLFKRKKVPFQFKEVSELTQYKSQLLSAGTRSVKVGDDIFTSSVRTISDPKSALSVVRSGDDFALELTKQKKFNDKFLFQTRTIKESSKGLTETFRDVGFQQKVGKIGSFDISAGASLGTKVDDIIRIKQPRLKGLLDPVDDVFPSQTKRPVTSSSPSLQSQLLTNVKTSAIQKAEEVVKSTTPKTSGFVPIVSIDRKPRVKRGKTQQTPVEEFVPVFDDKAITKPTVIKPSPRQKTPQKLVNTALTGQSLIISQDQQPRLDPLIAKSPSFSPLQAQAQQLSFGFNQPLAKQQKQFLMPKTFGGGGTKAPLFVAPPLIAGPSKLKLESTKRKKKSKKKKGKRRGFETQFLGSVSEFVTTGKTKRGKRKVSFNL